MKNYKYIIIGGGMTGSTAAMGIRKNDQMGSIAMFSKEKFGPYNRPPLTKGLWNGMQIEDIVRPIEKYQVDLYLQSTIVEIQPDKKAVLTEQGDFFGYQKLLLAVGGHPIQLPDAPEDVIYYRTRGDYLKVKALSEKNNHYCVIGGGFIGSEIAAALTKYDNQVTMIFPENGISELIFPDDLSKYMTEYYRDKGVKILSKNLVESIEKENDAFIVSHKNVDTGDVSKEKCDAVIVGIGIKPNLSLAKKAGIEVDNGIVVDEYLQTSQPDIFSAGDVAAFNHQGLHKRIRVEHEDNANKMGMTAGINMSGKMEKYTHFPFFYSDLFDLGYEAVGEMNKDYDIYEDWIEPFKKGTLFYLRDQKIRGLIFWNLWGKVDRGRDIISKGAHYDASNLKGLFTED